MKNEYTTKKVDETQTMMNRGRWNNNNEKGVNETTRTMKLKKAAETTTMK